MILTHFYRNIIGKTWLRLIDGREPAKVPPPFSIRPDAASGFLCILPQARPFFNNLDHIRPMRLPRILYTEKAALTIAITRALRLQSRRRAKPSNKQPDHRRGVRPMPEILWVSALPGMPRLYCVSAALSRTPSSSRAKVSCPSWASTRTLSPSWNSPCSRRRASGSCTWRWMTRFSGRAPKAGS